MKAIKGIFRGALPVLMVAFFIVISAFVVHNPELAEDGDPVCKPPVFQVDGSLWGR